MIKVFIEQLFFGFIVLTLTLAACPPTNVTQKEEGAPLTDDMGRLAHL